MPRFKIRFLAILLCAGSFFVCSDEPAAPAETQEQAHSRYFQDSGSQVDSLIDRIWFKITHSWMKSGEYFRLAFSSVPDSLPAKQRDVQSRIEIKKDELVEQGREAFREAADKTAETISEKGNEMKENLSKAGSEIADEARKEIRENTDKLIQ